MDLTVCIPTLEAMKTLPIVIDSIADPQKTGLRDLKVSIIDNGSRDGTPEYVEAIIRNKYFKYLTISLAREPIRGGGIRVNLPILRKRFSDTLQTEYLFFLDSDVLLPPFAIQDLYNDFKSKKYKHCGMLCINYDVTKDFVQNGVSIIKTSNSRKIDWKWEGDKCDCWFCKESLEKIGLSMEYHPEITGRHIKYR